MPMTSFRNYQSLSLAPLLSILYSQPHHSYFTRYVSAKRCKKAPAISAADQFSRSFFAKVLVLSLIQSFYVSFRDINTTVSICDPSSKLIFISFEMIGSLNSMDLSH